MLVYMEPMMLAVDVGGLLFNQNRLIACIATMQELDDKLRRENIIVNYRKLRNVTVWLVVLITMFESGIVTFNSVVLGDTMWFGPLYVSTIAKVWYIALVYNIKQKFLAINLHFDEMQRMFSENKKKMKASQAKSKSWANEQIGYLHREIVVKQNSRNQKFAVRRKPDIVQVQSHDLLGMHVCLLQNSLLEMRRLHETRPEPDLIKTRNTLSWFVLSRVEPMVWVTFGQIGCLIFKSLLVREQAN